MKQTVRVFVVVKVFERLSFGWFFGTYVLFLLGHGLTLFHANLLNTAFMAGSFLLDPFTGYLADRIGQKKVYVWGQFFWVLGMAVYAFGQSFPVFLVAELVGAIGSALISDALESWLRNCTDEEVTHHAITRAGELGPLATIPSAFLGGIIGEVFGFQWPWILASITIGLTMLLAIVLLRKMPDGRVFTEGRQIPLGIAKTAHQVWSLPPLRMVLMLALFSGACFQAFNMFWAPIMSEMSGSSWWLGSMWIGVALALSFGSRLARRWLNLDGAGIAFALLITGVPMLLNSSFPILFLSVSTFLLHEVGRGAIGPLIWTYSNRYIANENRSTANSIRNAFMVFGSAIGLMFSGTLTLWFSPLAVWRLSATALVVLAFFAWRLNHD